MGITRSQGLLKFLLKNVDAELAPSLVAMAARHEHRLTQGSKAIYHLEAFVAGGMASYRAFLEEGLQDDMF